VEVLARGLPKAIVEKGFHFHPKCVKLKLTHLDFNDDIVLFTREITLPFTLWGTPYKIFPPRLVWLPTLRNLTFILVVLLRRNRLESYTALGSLLVVFLSDILSFLYLHEDGRTLTRLDKKMVIGQLKSTPIVVAVQLRTRILPLPAIKWSC